MRGKTQAKENTEKLIASGKIFNVETAKDHQGKWQKFFNNENKIIVDLGMGSGLFLKNLILHEQKHDIDGNYIGIEIKGERVWKSYRKLEGLYEAGNVTIINMFVNKINQVFGKNELDEIYLIYPDPWPKDRHEKHRMTSIEFIKMYEKILKKKGFVYFKTDNPNMYKFTKEQFARKGWKLLEQSEDLQNSEYWLKDVESDFEKVFKLEKKKFYYLKYQFS